MSIRESCEVLLLTPRPVWVHGPAPAPCHGAEILRRLILPLTSVSSCVAATGSVAVDEAIGLDTSRAVCVMQF